MKFGAGYLVAIVLLLLGTNAAVSHATDEPQASLRAAVTNVVQPVMETHHISGMAVGIVAGTKTYANPGIATLGLITAKSMGQDFTVLMEQHLLPARDSVYSCVASSGRTHPSQVAVLVATSTDWADHHCDITIKQPRWSFA
jgi:hypothetical protein